MNTQVKKKNNKNELDKKIEQDNLVIPLYSIEGEKKEDISIRAVQIKESYNSILENYIHVFLTNQRKGTAHTKTRGEVVGTTKKVYKQKGTGNARHGSKKAPIFVGGGVVGGPRKKLYHSSFTKKQKKIALITTISQKIREGKFICLDEDSKNIKIRTKTAYNFLKKLDLSEKKTLYFRPVAKESNIYFSMRNIQNVTITPIENINPYILLVSDTVVLQKELIPQLELILEKN